MNILWKDEDLDVWIPSVVLTEKYGVSRHRLERLAKNGIIQVKKGTHPHVSSLVINYYLIPSSSFRVTTSLGPTNPAVIQALNFVDPINLPYSKNLNEAISGSGTVEQYLKDIAQNKNLTFLTKQAVELSSAPRKILSLSDLHFPFQCQEAIDEALAMHSDADILVLNGDILDGYAASSFGKNKNIPMHLEYIMALDFVNKVSKMFPQVYLVRGNHEARVEKYLSARIDPTMTMFGRKDVLSYLASGYVFDEQGEILGYIDMPNVHYNSTGNPWILQLGKTVFIHPNSFSSGPFATCISASEYLQQFLGADNFDSVVMGHTHKLGKMVYKGKLLIEQGCLVKVMDYNKNGKFIKEPSSLGYAVIYQDAVTGRTCFNSSQVVYLGTLNYLQG